MKIELLEEVGSTNEYIRRYLPFHEDVIVCAERQTGGKGTKGRSFLSERGGVYLSSLTFYPDLPAREAFRVMMHAAVSVCRTAERFSALPQIKWPNDVFVGGGKVCGILIENVLEGEQIRASIVGIGLNVHNDVSPLGGIAATLSTFDPTLTVEIVRDELIRNLTGESDFSDYVRYLRTGYTALIEEGGRRYPALVRGVREDGRLEIEEEGKLRLLSAAEIVKIGEVGS